MTSIGIVVTCLYPSSPLPSWIDLFLESCRRNPSVDFFVVANRSRIPDLRIGRPAPNIEVVGTDGPELLRRASERLGLEVKIPTAQKLFDFKPTYGAMFEDLVGEYDFFGYCDLDLFFGDIRKFMTEEVLGSYDVIFTREEFPTGHFSLFRRGLSRLYERSRDYERVLTSPRIFSFGECGRGLHYPLLHGAHFADIAKEAEVDSLMHVIDRSTDLRVHYRTICDEYLPKVDGRRSRRQQVLWEDGSMHDVATGRELIYYHLQSLKRHPSFYVPRWETLPRALVIDRKGVRKFGRQTLGDRWRTATARRRRFVVRSASLVLRWLRSKLRRLRGAGAPRGS